MRSFRPRPSRRQFLAAGLGTGAVAGCNLPKRGARELDERDALDERLADLTDQSGDVAPISGKERAQRRARLGALLRQHDRDAILVEPGATMTYLTGVRWRHSERLFALVVDADGEHFWVVPGFEETKARKQIDAQGGPGGELLLWQEHEYPYRDLSAALRERSLRRLAIEPQLRYGFVARLVDELPHLVISNGAPVVIDLRARKDAHELQLMRRANELTQLALTATARELRPGMTGNDISRVVVRAQQRLGLTDIWDLSLIGPDAAQPHGQDGDRPLAFGDLVLIDTGGALHGYQSDNTRTWVFDAAPTKRQRTVWNAVRDAQRAAFEAIRPGRRAGEIDGVARRVLTEAGFGPGYHRFTHRLGHGIGLEVHEDPYFDSGSQVVLAPGMTLSDEPGVYIEGELGVRIEDIVVVTEDGADHFGEWQPGPGWPS